MSHSGRIVTVCCAGTLVLSFGAGEWAPCSIVVQYLMHANLGVYFAFTTYGAFAVREFIGHDLFNTLLTENPTRWPWHAWINLPLVPLTLIASRTPLVLWTTSPLVPLLFSWPSTAPVNAAATSVGAAAVGRRLVAKPQLWPPPPVIVCVLFPSIRAIYTRLRERLTHTLVSPRQQQQQRPRPVHPPPQAPQQQGQQQQNGGGGAAPIGLRIREFFDWEMRAHIRVGGGGAGGDAANNNNNGDNHHHHDEAAAPAAPPQQPAPVQQQQPPPPPPPAAAAAPINDDDFARTIRLTSASFGRLIGGALAMPTIARMMGAALLRLSHVLPLVRVIIAPREQQAAMPPAAAVGLFGLWNNLQRFRLFGGDGWKQEQRQIVVGNGTAWGGKVLSGLFLTTSQEWAMSDPVWYV